MLKLPFILVFFSLNEALYISIYLSFLEPLPEINFIHLALVTLEKLKLERPRMIKFSSNIDSILVTKEVSKFARLIDIKF